MTLYNIQSTQPITRRQILDSSKLKEFADNNFKFDENGRKLSKRVENTVGKGEIARYEQFLLFPQCFEKACFPGASKGVIVWERVNTICVHHTINKRSSCNLFTQFSPTHILKTSYLSPLNKRQDIFVSPTLIPLQRV